MKFLILAAAVVSILGGCKRASAVEITTPNGSAYTVTLPRCTEQFPQLPKLAARLHIKPLGPTHSPTFSVGMCDGRNYAIFDIINAVLDRLDKASK